MTIDERFERIEHVTAGLAEQYRKDREESRQLWRDTQRQLNDVTFKLNDLTDKLSNLAEESAAADRRLATRMEELDQRLSTRIESLVVAMGEFIRRQSPGEAR